MCPISIYVQHFTLVGCNFLFGLFAPHLTVPPQTISGKTYNPTRLHCACRYALSCTSPHERTHTHTLTKVVFPFAAGNTRRAQTQCIRKLRKQQIESRHYASCLRGCYFRLYARPFAHVVSAWCRRAHRNGATRGPSR